MRYLIIGAGAIGATIGALLTESGRDVVLVARGAQLETLQSKGMRFATPRSTQTLQIPAVGGPEELELQPDDVLLLCVKSQDTIAVLEKWADQPVAGGGFAAELLPMVCVQNGVENERAALRWFAQVYGISVMLPASYLEPGVSTAVGDPLVGVLILGHYPAGDSGIGESSTGLAERMSADLNASRLCTRVVADVQRWKYAKLLRNLGNSIEVICGPGPRDLGHHDQDDSSENADALARLRQLVMAEGAAALAGAGIDWVSDAEHAACLDQLTLREVPASPRYGGSSWQSLRRGGQSIESAYLNGEIVLLGRLHGIPVPINARLQRLAEHAAQHGIAPGSTSAAQLLAGLG